MMARNTGSTSSYSTVRHVVALPYPGRGHINPMMNLCRALSSASPSLLVTFVVTEEWLSLIDRSPQASIPDNLLFSTIPNVIPSESTRGNDFLGFLDAVMTKMEVPLEQLLDRFQKSQTAPSLLLFDTILWWAVGVGSRRGIPVASFWTQSSARLLQQLRLLLRPGAGECDESDQHSQVRLPESQSPNPNTSLIKSFNMVREFFKWVPKSQYIILASPEELEPEAVKALRAELSIPIYSVGPVIPYLQLQSIPQTETGKPDYLKWLDSQPEESVLYVSLGSFMQITRKKMEEFGRGLRESEVRYLWVVREESNWVEEICGCGERGRVISWCDQLRVLMHKAVGGFWSHCGWNSTVEGVYAGVAFLTFPIALDQDHNSQLIVEEWRIGRKVGDENGDIPGLVREFMNKENEESREMRKRARQLGVICRDAIGRGSSSEANIRTFLHQLQLSPPANF